MNDFGKTENGFLNFIIFFSYGRTQSSFKCGLIKGPLVNPKKNLYANFKRSIGGLNKAFRFGYKKTQEGAKEDLTHGCFKDPRII